MTTVASTLRAPAKIVPTGLPRSAAWWLGAVSALAVVCGLAMMLAAGGHTDSRTFVLLLVGAVAAQALATQMPGNQVFHTGLAFTVAGTILLAPAALLILCVVQHIPDWLRQRYPWYIQTFNIANYLSSAVAGWSVYHAVGTTGHGLRHTLALAAGAGAFVLVNHALLAVMLRLARGRSLRETELFSFEGGVTGIVLAASGVVIALLVLDDPWAAPIAAIPLILIHRALAIPSLREQAFRDAKTELLNTRGLEQEARRELTRAIRFDRPLSVLLVDVDDLRAINNRHGHLTGDVALKAVAAILSEEAREYDACARFGGDEFVVVLPETSLEQAAAMKERLLSRIAEIRIPLRTGDELAVRTSIGAAVRDEADQTVQDIVRRADQAMYDDKPLRPLPAGA